MKALIDKPFYIISAESTNRGKVDNDRASEALLHQFALKELPSKEVVGCYKGTKERSFVVHCSQNDALELAIHFQQESVLFVDQFRNASLLYTDPLRTPGEYPIEPIGRFEACTKEEALASDGYTQDPTHDNYYHVI